MRIPPNPGLLNPNYFRMPMPEIAMYRAIDMAERLPGVDRVTAYVSLPEVPGHPSFEYKADNPIEAASINKMAIAYALNRLLEGATEEELAETHLSWDNSERASEGGGIYDQSDAPRSATVLELYEDMLMRSGNTAATTLARTVGPERINDVLEACGYSSTRLTIEESGSFTFGQTTARESVRLITELVDLDGRGDGQGHPLLKDLALASLRASETHRYGVRRVVQDESMGLVNKTGQLNRQPGVSQYLRHDVGIMQGPDGWRAYAFLSCSDTAIGAQFANQSVGRLGAELASQLGLRRTSVKAQLGREAAAAVAAGMGRMRAFREKGGDLL